MLGIPEKLKALSVKRRVRVLLGVVFLIHMVTMFATYLAIAPITQQWNDYQEVVVQREDLLMKNLENPKNVIVI